MPVAEQHKVTVAMELLNSKVNHKDYMCDKSAGAWNSASGWAQSAQIAL